MTTALAQGKLLSVSVQTGARLICHQGRLLVTMEGVTQDFDLAAGQSLTLLNDGLLVIEALLPAELEWVRMPRRLPLLGALVRLAQQSTGMGAGQCPALSHRRLVSADFLRGRLPA